MATCPAYFLTSKNYRKCLYFSSVSDDLNLPSITWSDGGIINSCSTYGHGINQLFLDTVNEYGLEQLII